MVDRSQRHAVLAQAAADRLERARAVGAQLGLFGGEAEGQAAAPVPVKAGPGRPEGSRNRVHSAMREMLAARGARMPEDVLAEMAGLTARGLSSMEMAMARAEQVMDWIGRGNLTPGAQLSLVLALAREQRLALEALLPYVHQKLAPDTVVQATQTTVIQMPGAAPAPVPGEGARVVGASGPVRFAPPPLPGEAVQDQGLSGAVTGQSDSASRTREASR